MLQSLRNVIKQSCKIFIPSKKKGKERHAQDNCPVEIIFFFIDCQDPRLQFRDPMDKICKAGKNGTYSNATNTNATKKQTRYFMHDKVKKIHLYNKLNNKNILCILFITAYFWHL